MSRQDIYASREQLIAACQKYKFKLTELSPQLISELNQLHPVRSNTLNIRNDQIFWREVGFESICSIDALDFEGATHVLDLNHRAIPDSLKQSFDWVMDIGTMEHVFHIPNYLSNLHDLIPVGGIIWQMVPANNWVNHGFYQFSPTLLNDFYVQNGWKILDRSLLQIDDHWAKNLNRYELNNEAYFVEPLQRLDNQYYFSSILVQKTEASRCDRIPQQYTYIKHQWASVNKEAVDIEKIVKIRKFQGPSFLSELLPPLLYKMGRSLYKTGKKALPKPVKRGIKKSIKLIFPRLTSGGKN